ncbi:hypothetical protein GALL_190220 [mine drainage metagenome]|uniref:DUF3617 family protein n=1 Tax=mine drainage metagenome TaxID=410659 RepID=A0A1J5S479_9ZZZZ
MNRNFVAILGLMTGLLTVAAYAAPGEYWEVTSKMEMPGMPFAMPATTTKVCIPKGAENNPEKTSGDKSCKMTDVKTVGNKTTWKARCDRDGEVMTGVGEQTTTANGYDGKMQFSGKSHGQDMNMNMAFSGKRIGGSCDSEEAVKKAKEDASKLNAQMCDTSRYHNTAEWISGSGLILQEGSPCANQRKQLCELVRRDTPKDADAYNALITNDQMTGNMLSIAKECKLDMAATTKSICKTINGENYNRLSAHCPAQAKAYREVQRRKDCEGRSYTAETRAADIRKCLSGKSDSPDDSASGDAAAAQKSSDSSGSNTASDVLEAAKKLKSKFGF